MSYISKNQSVIITPTDLISNSNIYRASSNNNSNTSKSSISITSSINDERSNGMKLPAFRNILPKPINAYSNKREVEIQKQNSVVKMEPINEGVSSLSSSSYLEKDNTNQNFSPHVNPDQKTPLISTIQNISTQQKSKTQSVIIETNKNNNNNSSSSSISHSTGKSPSSPPAESPIMNSDNNLNLKQEENLPYNIPLPTNTIPKKKRTKKPPVKNVMIPLPRSPSPSGSEPENAYLASFVPPPTVNITKRARSNNFTVGETNDLLEIWSKQTDFNSRNFRGWNDVSQWMKNIGHVRNALQCKTRIQNLMSTFYRVKKGDGNFNFPYFDVLNKILKGDKNESENDEEQNMNENDITETTTTTTVISSSSTNNEIRNGQDNSLENSLASGIEFKSASSSSSSRVPLSPKASSSLSEIPVISNMGCTIKKNTLLGAVKKSNGMAKASSSKTFTATTKNTKLSNRNVTPQSSSSSSHLQLSPITTTTTRQNRQNSVTITPIISTSEFNYKNQQNSLDSRKVSNAEDNSMYFPTVKMEPPDDSPESVNDTCMYNFPKAFQGKQYCSTQTNHRDNPIPIDLSDSYRPSVGTDMKRKRQQQQSNSTFRPSAATSSVYCDSSPYGSVNFSVNNNFENSSSVNDGPKNKRPRTHSVSTATSTVSREDWMQNEFLNLKRESLSIERQFLLLERQKVEIERTRMINEAEVRENHRLFLDAIIQLLQIFISERHNL